MNREPTHLTTVRAVLITSCPLLATHLTELHPGVRAALITNVAGIGALASGDALLLLSNDHHRDHPGGQPNPARNGLRTTTLYIATTPDDPDVWDRATTFHASEILFSPADDDQLRTRLAQHLRVLA